MKQIVLLVFGILCATLLNAQSPTLDSLQLKLQSAVTASEKATLSNEIANQFKYSDPEMMLEFGQKALQVSEENKLQIEQGTAYLNIGTAHIILGQYKKAMDHFVWAKSVFEETDETPENRDALQDGIARTYGSMGIVFSEQSNYAKALQYYLLSAKIYEERSNASQASKIYNNIGVVYRAQEQTEKALRYFLKALDIQLEKNDPNCGITQTNIANGYFELERFDEAFQYYTSAKKSIDQHPNPRALGEWYNNMGAYYNSQKYTEEALVQWELAISTFESIGDKFGLADTYLHLAALHLAQANAAKALHAAEQALILAKETQVLEQQVVAEKLLSDIYEKNGNTQQAYLHFKKYSTTKDSLVQQNDTRIAVEAAMNYEFEKKELLQREASEKRELLLREEAKSTNLKIAFGGLIVLLLFGIGFLIYNRNQLKKNLTLQKELAEYEQKALHLQMNPHFVFNCLGSISSFIVQNGTDSAIKYLSKFSKLMRLTLEYSKETLIPIDKEIESLQNYLELEQLRFNNMFTFEINKDSAIEDDVALPPLLIQPFIENAIIHGVIPKKEHGRIQIDFEVTETSLNCTITDDGVGINQSKKNKENLVLAHKSMALDIIRKRLEMITEATSKETHVSIEELTQGDIISGTRVHVQLPLQYIND